MKRHPALVPLSHDHHHSLVQARRLRTGAGGPDSEAVAAAFVGFFSQESVRHFRDEEELFFPALVESDEAREPLIRALLEHQRLHALVGRLAGQLEGRAADPMLMRELAELLEEHIRFEERQLFPLLEQVMPTTPPQRPFAGAGGEAGARAVDLHAPRGKGPVWGADSDDLNATLLVWGAGGGTPRHVNDERDVLIIVLSGSAAVAVGDRIEPVIAGQALLIAKGESREITAGPEGVRYISVHRRRPPLRISPLEGRPGDHAATRGAP
jgi:mannose-6-phosphate isomerase-like protein (cupin superfamily)